MSGSFDIWKMLAGVAIFLLGMNFMEEALKILVGRRFKLFLKKQTSNKVKAIGGGAIVTGLLQSSSVVNLLVLSMVGAGVIKMQNALAVMLGSNLGTTLDSWIVATLGFQVNIENYAMPVAGIAGISLAFLKAGSRWWQWSRFLLGLAFIFIGLGFIKEGMEEWVKQTDLTRFNESPAIVFLLIGFLLTTIIQSSSATIALTLSALFTGAITLYTAMAIVLGSEIGTTIKLFLASIKGIAAKKRVSLGNFLFNTINVTLIFIFLKPVYSLVTAVGIKDNLLALVFFQSFVNVVGILLFYPFLNVFGKFLEKRFAGKEDETLFIQKVNVSDTGFALGALEKETQSFLLHILHFITNAFESRLGLPENVLAKSFPKKTVAEQYDHIKHIYGDIHQFYIQLQNATNRQDETVRLEQLIICARNGMYAAKSTRDILHDIDQTKNSANDIKYQYYQKTRAQVVEFCKQATQLILADEEKQHFNEIRKLFELVPENYSKSLEELYRKGIADKVDEQEISTLLNFNREMYTTFKSLMLSLKEFLLNAEEAEQLDSQPGFIR